MILLLRYQKSGKELALAHPSFSFLYLPIFALQISRKEWGSTMAPCVPFSGTFRAALFVPRLQDPRTSVGSLESGLTNVNGSQDAKYRFDWLWGFECHHSSTPLGIPRGQIRPRYMLAIESNVRVISSYLDGGAATPT